MKKNILFLTAGGIKSSASLNYDIYTSLVEYGHDVIFVTRDYNKINEGICFSVYGKFETFIRKYYFKIKSKIKVKTDFSYYMFGLDEKKNYVPPRKILKYIKTKPDIILYSFTHNFLNTRTLHELSTAIGTPVFIMPMDLAPFTGGCHYTNKCEGYVRSCGNCPGIFSSSEKDITHQNMMYKKKYINKTNICLLGNTWSLSFANRSFLYSNNPYFDVSIPVNENIFIHGDKDIGRNYFSIPFEKKVIFFGASAIEEKRKGLSFLIDALDFLYDELDDTGRSNICVVFAGNASDEFEKLISFKTYYLGFLDAQEELPMAFQMSDVFVSPSIQDAGPMTVIHSLMCGTPVVAFEMGNALDLIIDGKTGFKAPLENTQILKENIYTILTMPEDEKGVMSKNCREIAKERCSFSSFAGKLTNIMSEY